MRGDARQRGLALLSALLAVALLTLVVVEMADSTLLHAHLARNAGNAMAAQLLARSAEIGGEALLIEDRRQNGNVTSRDGLWAIPLAGIPAGPGQVALAIQDEAGKLDLNRIGEKPYRRALDNLFRSLELPLALLDAVAAWTSPDAQAAAERGGQECRLDIPCIPPQGGLRSIEDLRLIPGFDDKTLSLLRPFVTASPRKGISSSLNVNTAPALVLQAIGCDVGADFVPPPGGYESSAKFDEDVRSCETALSRGVNSNLFSILATGWVGDTTQAILALVERKGTRVARLTWFERPVFDLGPAEVR